jgi:hypothetical protein
MRGSAFGGSCRIVASGQADRITQVASLPARSGFDKLEVPACQVRPLLGGRSTVGHRALDAVIGVRIPASQPLQSLRSFVAARQVFRRTATRLRRVASGHESLPPCQTNRPCFQPLAAPGVRHRTRGQLFFSDDAALDSKLVGRTRLRRWTLSRSSGAARSGSAPTLKATRNSSAAFLRQLAVCLAQLYVAALHLPNVSPECDTLLPPAVTPADDEQRRLGKQSHETGRVSNLLGSVRSVR